MITIVNIIRLISGLALLTGGGSLIRESPRLGGFLVGGLAAVEVTVRVMVFAGLWTWAGPLLAFALGGLVGMLLGSVLSMFLLVIYTSLLGAVAGYIFGFLLMMGGDTQQIIETVLEFSSIDPLQTSFMVVFALVFGLLSVRFQEFMAMASTAFLGSALTIFAIADQLRRFAPVFREDIVLLFTWVALGLFGLIWQNNNTRN